MSFKQIQVTNDSSNSIVTNGGIKVNKSVNISGTLQVFSSANIGGITSITNTTESMSQGSGSLVVHGGTSIGKNIHIGGNIFAKGDELKLEKFELYDGILTTCQVTCDNIVSDRILTESIHSNGDIVGKNTRISDLVCLNVKSNGNIDCDYTITSNSLCVSENIKGKDLYIQDIQASGSCSIQSLTCLNMDTCKIFAKEATFTNLSSSLVTANNCNLTGNLQVYGISSLSSLTVEKVDITDCLSISKDLTVLGDIKVGKSMIIDDSLKVNCTLEIGNGIINSNMESTSTFTGSLVICGGIGINGNIFSGGTLSVNGATFMNSAATVFGSFTVSDSSDANLGNLGALIVSGGSTIMKNLVARTDVSIWRDLQVSGHSFLQSVQATDVSCTDITCKTATFEYCQSSTVESDTIRVTGTTDSSTCSTGALVVGGGMGIHKSLYVGSNIIATGNITGECISSINGRIILDNVEMIQLNGLLNMKSSTLPGLRLTASEENKKSRYFNSLDLFGLGSNFTDNVVEALQISNDSLGNWRIISRASGSGTVGNLELSSGTTKVVLESNGNIKFVLGKYTMILPQTVPPTGKSMLIYNSETGNLEWEKL
jgi:hypothetical protein